MMLTLFLPCAGGVEGWLADEVHGLTGLVGDDLLTLRGGVRVRAGPFRTDARSGSGCGLWGLWRVARAPTRTR